MKSKGRKRRFVSLVLVIAMLFMSLPPYVGKAASTGVIYDSSYKTLEDAVAALENGGKLIITRDWNTSKALKIKDHYTVELQLNGHMINRGLTSEKKDGEVIWLGEYSKLTIDGGSTSIVHEGSVSNNLWYPDKNKGTEKVSYSGGMIVGGNSTNGAGGIHMKSYASVFLTGVTLAGNMSYHDKGGAIRATGKNSNITLDNCRIEYNRAGNYGGAIYLSNSNCTIHMKNGSTMSHNKSDSNDGGALYSDGECTTLNLGENCHIDSNSSGDHGGALYFNRKHTTIEMDDTASISNNQAKNDGGAIYFNREDMSIKMNGAASISKNQAGGNGGAIYSNDNYTIIEMDDTASISNNQAKKGGAIYFNYSCVSIVGGNISNNIASNGGAGVYLQHYSRPFATNLAILCGIIFENNQSKGEDGGAVHVEQENTTIMDCTFTGNTTGNVGGAIYVYNDKCTITGCTITNNQAGSKGGGVYVSAADDIALGGRLIIKDNTVKGQKNNLHLGNETWNSYITSSPSGGSEVGITSYTGQISKDTGHFVASVFYSDKEDMHTEWREDRKLYMVEGARQKNSYQTVTTSKAEVDTTKGQVNGKDVLKGYFSYPSMEDAAVDLDAVFYYSDGYFKEDATKYNPQLATMSMALAMSAFNSSIGTTEKPTDYTMKSQNVKKMMTDIGVAPEDVYVSDTYSVKPGTNTIGVAIGNKKIDEDGTILIPIAVRGAGYESEWTGNVSVGEGSGEHKGFALAADQVMSQVESYIANHNLTQAAKNGKLKFWVVGYSRAGATANLTAKRLVDEYQAANNSIFGYCMEAPQGGTKELQTAGEKKGLNYNCIHNCINSDDLVPRVAPNYMGFIRYGKDQQIDDTNKKSQLKTQLQAIDQDLAYDDYFHLATMNYIGSTVAGVFGIKKPMAGEVSGKVSAGAPQTLGEYGDKFVEKFQAWGIANREEYTSRPTGDLRKDTSLEPASFEEALQLVMPILFSKTEQEQNQLMAILSLKSNELSMSDIWSDVIGDEWLKMSTEEKKSWIWGKFWDTLVASKGGIGSKLTKQELTDLQRAWPTLLDVLLQFVGSDYQYPSWGAGPYDGSQVVVGTLAYNTTSLLQTHYPEVNFAWLRSNDSFYNNETKQVKITSEEKATVTYSLEGGTYQGSQELKLLSDIGGASLYYRVTFTKDGQETKGEWAPYNEALVLAEQESAVTYKVETKAAYCDNQTETQAKTYVVEPAAQYQVTIVAGETSVEQGSYKEGEQVRVVAGTKEGYSFQKWSSEDVSISESEAKNVALTFTMPAKNVTLNAEYIEKINNITVSELEFPQSGQEFSNTAKVSYNNGDVQQETIRWIVGNREDAKIVSDTIAAPNTTYHAVLALRSTEGQFELADKMKVNVNGQVLSGDAQNPIVQKNADGSVWIFCGSVTTDKMKLLGTPSVNDITVKAGTEEKDLPLPGTVLVNTDAGEKVVSVSGWVCEAYDSSQNGTYTFTGTLELEAKGIDKGEFDDTVSVNVIVSDKETATVPHLSDNSAEPGDYTEATTIYLTTKTVTDAKIMYQINEEEEKEYTEDGISLQLPATSGEAITYTVTAYTKSLDSEVMNDSEKVTFTYTLHTPYTVTIHCIDTGLQGSDGANWSETMTYQYKKGDKAYIVAPMVSDEQFELWKDATGVTISEADKENKIITVDAIEGDISLTAVYNPVVQKISLKVASPQTGKRLAQTESECKVTITNEYDLQKDFGMVLPIQWSPQGDTSRAYAKTKYTAKLSMSMDSDQAKFYQSRDLAVNVTDENGKEVASTWELEKDDTGKNVLNVYATFEETEKVKAVEVKKPDSMIAETHSSGEAIKKMLEEQVPKVSVKLEDGTYADAQVQWMEPQGYDATLITEQKVTVTGTITLPDYVDKGNIELQVEAEVYVPGAEFVKTPKANAAGGVYYETQTITLSTDTEGAQIYYTTDGTVPTQASTLYHDGIEVSQNTTIQAIAIKDGMQNSSVMCNDYYIHTHIDEDGDGLCDGIKIKDEIQPCGAVILGQSSGSQTVAADLTRLDDDLTMYLKVDISDIEKNYSTECYPTTAVKMAPSGDDASENTENQEEKHSFVFAGWYYEATNGDMTPYEEVPKDALESTEESSISDTGVAYAKFVDANVLTVGGQLSANTTKDSEKTNLRLLTSVDDVKYQSVGFEIQIENKNSGKPFEKSSTKVYEKVKAVDGISATSKTPQEVFENQASKYFLAFRINNIPKSAFDSEITVRAYWVTMDGTKVYGTKVFKNSVQTALEKTSKAE